MEMFFRNVGSLLLHILDPCRAAAGEHGEGAALFQPLQELVRLLHDGQVRAEGGVVHLVGAHHLQGGHQLVDGIDAGLQAEGLAHRHPDRRGDLEHHPLLRVVQGPPRPADLVEDGDGAGGAGGCALAAADAVGLCRACGQRPGITTRSLPRWAKFRMPMPCISSHTRMQSPQRMHLLGSRTMAGEEVSIS